MDRFCEALYDRGDIRYVDDSKAFMSIDDQIREDRKYGTFEPRNGKYFTFRVYGEDEEITNRRVVQAVHWGFRRWSIRHRIDVRRARGDDVPDFRIIFRTVESDERGQMRPSTIMYHYYPIIDLRSPRRGLCVVNSKFFYTAHGKTLPMHEIDPKNYKKGAYAWGTTVDIDQVFAHEFGHGLGLPHSANRGNLMSSNYGAMTEYASDEDNARIGAKYPLRGRAERLIRRWMSFMRLRSENY